MELKQLEAYVKVYELHSFSKAAEEMFVSQPSISAYINALEKELHTQLIYRSTKEFLPTKSGKLFYEYAKKMLLLRDQSVRSLNGLSDCAVGSINILASSVPAQYILPELLGAFHKVYPDVVFHIEQADTSEVVKSIASHKSEIGFVGAKIENPKCVYKNFMSEKLILIAPPEKRFEKIKAGDIAGLLREEHFVMREPGSGTRLEYEEHLENIGIRACQLKISASFNNTQSILHAVANGLGLSIVSEIAAKHYIENNMVVPVHAEFLPERNFYIILKKNYAISAIVDTFIQFVDSYSNA